MSRHEPWRTLGIAQTDDLQVIRRAYADKLRQIDPDADVKGFSKLRQARDAAIRIARSEKHAAQASDRAIGGIDDPVINFDVEDPDEEPPHDMEPEHLARMDAVERLSNILFPNGEQSDEGLNAEENADAHEQLTFLLEDMVASDLSLQRAGEDWLAGQLCHAWPRSAPLVLPAAQALDWTVGKGEISEHPARAFLNDRLAGMAFEEEVSHPSHRLWRAWTELVTPGEKGWFGVFRVRRKRVMELLNVVRTRFPELEHRFDGRKIETWEKGAGLVNPWIITVGLFVVLRILIVFVESGPADTKPSTSLPNFDAPSLASQREETVQAMFGSQVDFLTVNERAPTLGRVVDGLINQYADSNERRDHEARLLTRKLLYGHGLNQSKATLVAVKRLKLDVVRQLRDDHGSWACANFLREMALPDHVDLPSPLLDRENELMRQMIDRLDEHMLKAEAVPDRSVSIDGRTIQAVQNDSGLDHQALDKALNGKGNDIETCAAITALMAHVLAREGDYARELLEIL